MAVAPPAFQIPEAVGDLILLGKWHGRVVEVTDDQFEAVLVDQLEDQPEEYATFSQQELSDQDRMLLVPGALFYWAISYVIDPAGVRTRQSIIRMQRLPVWSSEEIDRAHEWASRSEEVSSQTTQ